MPNRPDNPRARQPTSAPQEAFVTPGRRLRAPIELTPQGLRHRAWVWHRCPVRNPRLSARLCTLLRGHRPLGRGLGHIRRLRSSILDYVQRAHAEPGTVADDAHPASPLCWANRVRRCLDTPTSADYLVTWKSVRFLSTPGVGACRVQYVTKPFVAMTPSWIPSGAPGPSQPTPRMPLLPSEYSIRRITFPLALSFVLPIKSMNVPV